MFLIDEHGERPICTDCRRPFAELMRPELDASQFIQFNYWDSGHQGLLSGEALYLDIKRMELAYQN